MSFGRNGLCYYSALILCDYSANPLRISRVVLMLYHITILQLFCDIQTTKLVIVQLIKEVEEKKKNIRTWDGDVAFSSYNAFKRGVTISIFY